jgi:hypothetical protein
MAELRSRSARATDPTAAARRGVPSSPGRGCSLPAG